METARAQSRWFPRSRTICESSAPGAGNRVGFTLLESLVAVVILTGMMGLTLTVMIDASAVKTTASVTGELNMTARRCVDRVVKDLRYSGVDSDGWSLPEDVQLRTVSFSRCVGYDTATALPVWGPVVTYSWEVAPDETEDGVDNNNNGVIDEGLLYRDTDDASRAMIARNVVKDGFFITRSGSEVTIRVTIARRDPTHPSGIITGAFETSLVLRN